MTLETLIERIGAQWVVVGRAASITIRAAYAGDRVSDLLNQVFDDTLLITHLSNTSLTRLIELMDASAICLVNGVTPEEGLVTAAQEHGAALAVSPFSLYETCGKVYAALRDPVESPGP